MYANRLKSFSIFYEIGVEEQDGDVKFQTRSKNMAVSCMHNENYAVQCLLTDKWLKFPHPNVFLTTTTNNNNNTRFTALCPGLPR